jgi:hypothetical protein
MTGRELDELRRQIDHAKRLRLIAAGRLTVEPTDPLNRGQATALSRRRDQCRGCSMPLDSWTPGCQRCWERHKRRALRGTAADRQAFAVRSKHNNTFMYQELAMRRRGAYGGTPAATVDLRRRRAT